MTASYWDDLDLADDRLAAGFAGMALRRSKALEDGAAHVGWKMGINDIAFRERLGIRSGVAGWLTDRTQHERAVPVEGATGLAVEIEVAFVMGDGGTVTALRPAIEVVDIVGGDIDAALARDVWHHAFVLGPSTPWRDGLVEELTVAATHDGATVEVPRPAADKLADVDGLLRFAAQGAAALGATLAAGDVILAGNLVPSLIWATAGSTV
jgi:2-keto-4-pentenoate hydratase